MNNLMVILGLTDLEVKIAMWISGGLLTALFSLLSYFVIRGITIQDKLSESVQKLQITLSGMNAVIQAIQDEKCDFKNYYETRHNELQSEMDDMDNVIKDHGERITRVETKLSI